MSMADSVKNSTQTADELFIGEQAVRKRYSAAAQSLEATLCCPISYNPRYLKAIPQEILEKDYGCGDPSGFVGPGETVLDLGSGGGKLCFIAAQIVGKSGRVIGVDCNAEMLALARKYQKQFAENIGFENVDFRCGRIQDLRMNLELAAAKLANLKIDGVADLLEIRSIEQQLRTEQPLVADRSVDCVVSNCVLNLIDHDDRRQLFSEIHRVLKVGGRAAISDIVCDEDVPVELQQDPTLWSGCISGAWREDRFVDEFLRAGFTGVRLTHFQEQPWRTVYGYEFRSVTVVAYKTEGPCLERNQAVIYRGPFSKVTDDDGHEYRRGQRAAVCDRTYQALTRPPYEGQFIAIEPRDQVAPQSATEFDCTRDRLRHPRETKGHDCDQTVLNNDDICEDKGCC